ncbi:MAG: hypothetical protein SGI77_12765 [Pirellulaceae bacterium]|nr:hypothetical protein [Pirellulaceae bacterium]
MRFVFALLLACYCVRIASSQEVKTIPEKSIVTKLVRLHIVAGDYVSTSVIEVNADLFDKLPTSKEATLSAATYRLTADHKTCEAYNSVGHALKVSDTQIAIVLDEKTKGTSHLLAENLNTADPLKRHAILLYPPKPNDPTLAFAGQSVTDFSAAVQPRIDDGGLVAYPVDVGVRPLAVTCTCKAFFGCTSGCCTSPSCNVVVGTCQSNSDCKKVDTFSDCSCRQ